MSSGPSDCLEFQAQKADETNDENNSRRSFVKYLATSAVILTSPSPASAGEIGARITKAVTTSDLGISVRTSVVKGAQMMDRADGQWEKFSDKFGLGAERSKAGSRPAPKAIPELRPLDEELAKRILDVSDQTFSSVTGIPAGAVAERIQKVASTVQVSFRRSGVKIDAGDPLAFSDASQYNFVMYAHFKAYSDLLLEKNISFAPFKKTFETSMGLEMTSLFLRNYATQMKDDKLSSEEKLKLALSALDSLCKKFQENGLLAAYEVTPIDEEKLGDWADGISDLEFNLALDGDATLDSQILLQEQGFRLYPNLARFAAGYIMSQVDRRQKVSTMDYYFDTSYSSDPDLFEVKEVLVSVSLENTI